MRNNLKNRALTQSHYPWRSWCASDLNAEDTELFVNASTVSHDGSSSLGAIDISLLKREILKRCMKKYGFFVLRNIDLSTDSCSELGRIMQTLFRTHLVLQPQKRDGKLTLELSPSPEETWMEEQPFHTDAGHFLGLLCVTSAESGGESFLVSALKLHDVLSRESPKSLEQCFSNWKFHRNNRPGERFYEWPIFRYDADFGLSCYYLPRTIIDTPAVAGTSLSKTQISTINKIEDVLQRKNLIWVHKLSRGELLILNNKKILHSRAGYRNDPKRHPRKLLRVWINLPRMELSSNAPLY